MAFEDDELKTGADMPEEPVAETTEAEVGETVAMPEAEGAYETFAETETETAEATEPVEADGETVAVDGETVDAATVGYEFVEGEMIEEPKKKSKAPIIVVIVIVILAALCGLTYRFGGGIIAVNNASLDKFFYNKYNNMGYVDIYSMTLNDLIEENNSYAESEDEMMTLESFKERYDLPKDMRGDTNMTAMEYSIPIQAYASEIYGVDYDTLVTEFELDETEVNDQMTWGEFQGEVRLDVAIGGEEYLDEFKEEYGFGDEITAESKWKDVRTAVDQASKEQWEAYQQMYEEMMNSYADEDEEDVDEDADADVEEDVDIDADIDADVDAETEAEVELDADAAEAEVEADVVTE